MIRAVSLSLRALPDEPAPARAVFRPTVGPSGERGCAAGRYAAFSER